MVLEIGGLFLNVLEYKFDLQSSDLGDNFIQKFHLGRHIVGHECSGYGMDHLWVAEDDRRIYGRKFSFTTMHKLSS